MCSCRGPEYFWIRASCNHCCTVVFACNIWCITSRVPDVSVMNEKHDRVSSSNIECWYRKHVYDRARSNCQEQLIAAMHQTYRSQIWGHYLRFCTFVKSLAWQGIHCRSWSSLGMICAIIGWPYEKTFWNQRQKIPEKIVMKTSGWKVKGPILKTTLIDVCVPSGERVNTLVSLMFVQ